MNKLLPDPQLGTWVLVVIFTNSSYTQAKQGASHNCSLYRHTCSRLGFFVVVVVLFCLWWFVFGFVFLFYLVWVLFCFFFPSKISKQYTMKHYTKNSLHLTIG